MKKMGSIALVGIVVIIILMNVLLNNWPVRFKNELNLFFGKEHWKVINEEEKDSIIYKEHVHYYENPELDCDKPGKFKNWYIEYTNSDQTYISKITNHTYKINNSKYSILEFSKRFSAKQAFIQQLMDISMNQASENILDEMIRKYLTEEESECFDVNISYTGGNPSKKFYNKLSKENWFTIEQSSAENYLKTDLYDFYIWIRIFDYKFNKLPEDKKENVIQRMLSIENELIEKYGNNASFELIYPTANGDFTKVKYIGGLKEN